MKLKIKSKNRFRNLKKKYIDTSKISFCKNETHYSEILLAEVPHLVTVTKERDL
jgi:hypothetical protein